MATGNGDKNDQWDLLDQQYQEELNQADLEALKRKMLNGGLFWQDLLEQLSAKDKDAFGSALIDLEQVFQNADTMFSLSANPNANHVVDKLKIKLGQKPFLLPYVAIRLKNESSKVDNQRAFLLLLDNVRRSVDNYPQQITLFGTLEKWNDLHSEISRLLEKNNVSFESGNREVRYRISLTDNRLLQPETQPLSMDQKKLEVLRLYLKKIDRFISYMVDHPEAVSLQAAGYDHQEEGRVMKILAGMKA